MKKRGRVETIKDTVFHPLLHIFTNHDEYNHVDDDNDDHDHDHAEFICVYKMISRKVLHN